MTEKEIREKIQYIVDQRDSKDITYIEMVSQLTNLCMLNHISPEKRDDIKREVFQEAFELWVQNKDDSKIGRILYEKTKSDKLTCVCSMCGSDKIGKLDNKPDSRYFCLECKDWRDIKNPFKVDGGDKEIIFEWTPSSVFKYAGEYKEILGLSSDVDELPFYTTLYCDGDTNTRWHIFTIKEYGKCKYHIARERLFNNVWYNDWYRSLDTNGVESIDVIVLKGIAENHAREFYKSGV